MKTVEVGSRRKWLVLVVNNELSEKNSKVFEKMIQSVFLRHKSQNFSEMALLRKELIWKFSTQKAVKKIFQPKLIKFKKMENSSRFGERSNRSVMVRRVVTVVVLENDKEKSFKIKRFLCSIVC